MLKLGTKIQNRYLYLHIYMYNTEACSEECALTCAHNLCCRAEEILTSTCEHPLYWTGLLCFRWEQEIPNRYPKVIINKTLNFLNDLEILWFLCHQVTYPVAVNSMKHRFKLQQVEQKEFTMNYCTTQVYQNSTVTKVICMYMSNWTF